METYRRLTVAALSMLRLCGFLTFVLGTNVQAAGDCTLPASAATGYVMAASLPGLTIAAGESFVSPTEGITCNGDTGYTQSTPGVAPKAVVCDTAGNDFTFNGCTVTNVAVLSEGEAKSSASSANVTGIHCADYNGNDNGSSGIFAYYGDVGWRFFKWPFYLMLLAPVFACIAPLCYNCCVMNNSDREKKRALVARQEEEQPHIDMGTQPEVDKRDHHSYYLAATVFGGTLGVAISMLLSMLFMPFFGIPFMEWHYELMGPDDAWPTVKRELLFCVKLPLRDGHQDEVPFGYYLIWFYIVKWMIDLRWLCHSWRDPHEVAYSVPGYVYRCLSLFCLPCVWCTVCLGNFFEFDVPAAEISFLHTWLMQVAFHTYTEWAAVASNADEAYWQLSLSCALLSSLVSLVLLCNSCGCTGAAFSPVRAIQTQLCLSFLPWIALTLFMYYWGGPINEFVVFNFISKLLSTTRQIYFLTTKPNDSDYEEETSDDTEAEVPAAGDIRKSKASKVFSRGIISRGYAG